MILNLDELYEKYNMNITGVVHVGAHFGEEQNAYKKLGIEKIIYFEPVSKTFAVLKEKIKDAILYNVALGNSETEIEMFVEDLDKYGSSSILKPSLNHVGFATYSSKEKVQMKRLDSYNFTDYNFLNLDVQGYELEVLKGAEKTLNYVDYIMCEINRQTNLKPLEYENISLIEDVEDFLSLYGFKLVEANWAGLSWGVGFFIKNN